MRRMRHRQELQKIDKSNGRAAFESELFTRMRHSRFGRNEEPRIYIARM